MAKPKREKEAETWTVDEVEAFLEATSWHRWAIAFRLNVLYGLRRSELLALRWDDFDDEAGTLRIDESLVGVRFGASWSNAKNERSRRTIPLDDETLRVLTRRRAEQAAELRLVEAEWVDVNGGASVIELGTHRPGEDAFLLGEDMFARGPGGDRFGPDRSTVRLGALAGVAGGVETDAVGEDRFDRLLERSCPARAVVVGLWRRDVAERGKDVETVPDGAMFGEFRKNLTAMSDEKRAGFDETYEATRLALEVGERLRNEREAAGLSQRELAARMGTSQAAVTRLEVGGTGQLSRHCRRWRVHSTSLSRSNSRQRADCEAGLSLKWR